MAFVRPCLLIVLLVPMVCGWMIDSERRRDYRYLEDAFRRRAAKAEGCGQKPADIVFVLDESGSIYGPDFIKQLEFVKEVVQNFDVSQGMTHIGAMTFSTDTKLHFELDDIHGADSISNALDQIIQRRGGTRTFDAIRFMRTDMFSSQHSRQDVPRIGIVITDGESEDMEMTKQESQAAHQQGITMFAIGVGRKIIEEELHNIASSSDYVFKVTNYNALDKLKDELAKTACEVTTQLPPTTTTTPTTTTPTTTTTLPQSIEECDAHFPTDIQFAMSDQAGVEGTDLSLRYINSIVGRLTLSPDQALVGVTPRACDDSAMAILLKDNDDIIGFTRSIGERNLTGVNTAEHLRYMHNEGISPVTGARPAEDTARFGILIVDNKAADKVELKKQARKAQDDDIHLIVLGVGPYVDEGELEAVASSNNDWFHISSYAELDTLADPVMGRICEIVLQRSANSR